MLGCDNVIFRVKDKPSLQQYPGGAYDVVFSHLLLQQTPPRCMSELYQENARIFKLGDWITFQVPTSTPWQLRRADILKALVDLLPLELAQKYRARVSGQPKQYEAFAVACTKVAAVLKGGNAFQAVRQPDRFAGDDVESHSCVFRDEEVLR